MTVLPDLLDFRNNGVNTYERLLIRGTQMLLYLQNAQQSVVGYGFKDRVLMAVGWGVSPSVSVEITFDLKVSALAEKGAFEVLPFQSSSAFSIPPISPAPAQLFTEMYPAWVTDVENLIVWAGLSLNRPESVSFAPNYQLEGGGASGSGGAQVGTQPTGGSLVFSAGLPLDPWILQRTGGDLIAASKRINTDIPDYFA